MRKMGVWVVVVSLGFSGTVFGCSKDKAAPDPEGGTAVTLVSAGEGPKSTLRFKPAKGMSQAVDMTMAMTMTAMGKKVKIPPITMHLSTTVSDIGSDGRIHYDFSVKGMDMAGEGALGASGAAVFKEKMKGLTGITGHATVDDCGGVKDAKVDVPPEADPQISNMLESMQQAMTQIVAPLPTEAVGIGSKWDAPMEINVNGMKLKQVAHYELLFAERRHRGDGDQRHAERRPPADQEPPDPGGGEGRARVAVHDWQRQDPLRPLGHLPSLERPLDDLVDEDGD